MLALIIFGEQGSGKTTQAERIAQVYRFPLFETGTMLRQLAQEPTRQGAELRQVMKAGQLASEVLLEELLTNWVRQHTNTKGVVLEGFPRNLEQCQLLDKLAKAYRWQVVGVYVRISDATAKDRLGKRVVEVDGQLTKRADDQPEIVEKRLALFRQETWPIFDWIKAEHTLIEIDGEPMPDKVYVAIDQAIQKFLL